MELVADSGVLASVDVVEMDPISDVHNQTARLATELVASALGRRILRDRAGEVSGGAQGKHPRYNASPWPRYAGRVDVPLLAQE